VSEQFKNKGDAEWDQRQAFHQRLHNAIMLCYDSMHHQDFNSWYDSLLILYTELVGHMNDEELKDVKLSLLKTKNIMKYSNINLVDKKMIFHSAQVNLHSVMRNRGFDCPTTKHSPGSIMRNEKSF